MEESLWLPGGEFFGRVPRAEAVREIKKLLYPSKWEWQWFRLRWLTVGLVGDGWNQDIWC